MAYLYDTLVDALGGHKLIGAQGMDYGSWSPNNYRSVLITLDGILVEGHLGGVKLTKINPAKAIEDIQDSRSRNMLNAFELKKFMGLEELIIDSRLNTSIDRFMKTAIHEQGRFRYVTLTPFNELMFKVVATRIQEQRQKAPESTIADMFGITPAGRANGPSYHDWFAKVTLTGKVYSVDRIGGKLHEHLKGIAEAHGVHLVEEVIEERTYTEAQTANIQAHRANVLADMEADSLGQLEIVRGTLAVLKTFKDSPETDKEGVKLLASGLVERTKAKVPDFIPGLGFYLEEFGEADNIPIDLVDLYINRGFTATAAVPSSARIDEEGGYLKVDKAIQKAVSKVMKSRKDRDLYIPDPKLFDPRGRKLYEFAEMLTGADFDYAAYSTTLSELSKLNTGVSLEAYLDKRKQEGGDVADAVVLLSKELEAETSKSPFGFMKDIKRGIAKVSLRQFKQIDQESLVEYGDVMLTTGIKKGATLLAVKYPAVRKALPLINRGVDYSEQYLIEYVEKLLDGIEKGLGVAASDEPIAGEVINEDGEVVNGKGEGEGLTAETEQRLYQIFETQIFWSFGINMLDEMLTDCKDFSSLKYRQVERLSRASAPIDGLAEFLDKYKSKVGPNAVHLFKSTGYLTGSTVTGKGKDRMLDPEEFFKKLVDEFSNLSKRKVRTKALERLTESSGVKWDNMKIYNETARELMGLRGRMYGFPEGA